MDQRLRSDVHFTYALKPKFRLMMRISLPATAICRLFAHMGNRASIVLLYSTRKEYYAMDAELETIANLFGERSATTALILLFPQIHLEPEDLCY
ncbi:hypothetical protein KIN20_013907 [Parelaphostrongylus tenuis]|uniref:Uncharacterized protein n=1 Tax=Parelaphostrongylus tenuis TaxID=148309 RepID=A0AAD5QRE4_PARTN|nr:hypothetical protein KIN20_013907 [Parelaphostrongylus tenuis]